MFDGEVECCEAVGGDRSVHQRLEVAADVEGSRIGRTNSQIDWRCIKDFVVQIKAFLKVCATVKS